MPIKNSGIQIMREIIEKSQQLKDKFKASDIELYNFLRNIEQQELKEIYDPIRSAFNKSRLTRSFNREILHEKSTGMSWEEQEILSIILVDELKKYAGNTLNIFFSKPEYKDILKNLHKKYAQKYKKKFVADASIREREQEITEWLLILALEKSDDAELKDLLEKLKGKKPSLSKAEVKYKLLEGGIGTVGQIVETRFLKEFILSLVYNYVKKKMAEKATKKVLHHISRKLPQNAFKSILGHAALIFWAKEIIDLGGSADRIVVPTVTSIAISRTIINHSHASP